MDATFRGHLFGMTNNFMTRLEINHAKFGGETN